MPYRESGFTLVEAIIVIATTGIVAAMVGVFIQGPIEGYFDTSRRAMMTDVADTAFRRLARDVRRALPNSARIASSGGTVFLEFLETRTGGRYRADAAMPSAGVCPNDNAALIDNDILDFTAADTCLLSLGTVADLAAVTTSDFLVIYNLGQNIAGSDAYASGAVTGGNKAKITATVAGAPEEQINFEPLQFGLDSPTHRFQIVSGPVTYVCDPTAGLLRRYRGYAIQAVQPSDETTAPLSAAPNAMLADHLSACNFTYTQGVTERNGLLSVDIAISREGETVTLSQGVLIENTP
jgi:MSHA biogenesis protein MshO